MDEQDPKESTVHHPLLFVSGVLSVAVLVFASVIGFSGVKISRFDSLAALLPGVLLAHTNSDRVINGLPLLVENPLLSKAAQRKAEDMIARGYYAHVSPEGHTAVDLLNETGYRYLNVGENLDLTYGDSEAQVQEAWMNSPSHRSNILLPLFTEIGVGIASGKYKGEDVTFAVEIYATPLPQKPVAVVTVPNPDTPPKPKPVILPTLSAPPQKTSPPPKPATPSVPVRPLPNLPTSTPPAAKKASSSPVAVVRPAVVPAPSPKVSFDSLKRISERDARPDVLPATSWRSFVATLQESTYQFLLLRFVSPKDSVRYR